MLFKFSGFNCFTCNILLYTIFAWLALDKVYKGRTLTSSLFTMQQKSPRFGEFVTIQKQQSKEIVSVSIDLQNFSFMNANANGRLTTNLPLFSQHHSQQKNKIKNIQLCNHKRLKSQCSMLIQPLKI